jgi:cathepsin D
MTEVSGNMCIGAFFELGSSTPAWIIGDTFLVSLRGSPFWSTRILTFSLQKNVYSVFRYNPPSVGFAELSATALAMNAPGGNVPTATIGSVVATATGGGRNSSSAPARASSLISRSGILAVGLSLLFLLI